jgi:tetratricopeptide (TPR) repeat protein
MNFGMTRIGACLVGLCTAFSVYAQSGDELFNRAAQKYHTKDYEGAVADYSRIIESGDGPVIESYGFRGVSRYRLNQLNAAVHDLDDALERDENYDIAYNNRGVVLFAANEVEYAREDFQSALSIDGNYATAYNNLGLVAFRRKNYENAIQYFQLAIRSYPAYAQAYNNLGAALEELGETEEALDAYSDAIEAYPQYALALYNRGSLRLASKNKGGACEDLKKAAELGVPEAADKLKESCGQQ